MSFFKQISLSFDHLLIWLEEHQISILATIALHLLIFSLVLILKIRTYTTDDHSITVDLSQVSVAEEIQQHDERTAGETGQESLPENRQEFIQNLNREYNVRNIPVNIAEKRAVENIDKMVRDIKAEMNITDPQPTKDQPEDIVSQSNQLLENEAQTYDNKFPLNTAGERTIYRGPTTVSYELSGRRHTWMPAPVYKCRGGGTIAVDIVVNQSGYVISAEINPSKSDSEDPCLVEAAKRDAQRSRFDKSPINAAKQQGGITYIFVAQ